MLRKQHWGYSGNRCYRLDLILRCDGTILRIIGCRMGEVPPITCKWFARKMCGTYLMALGLCVIQREIKDTVLFMFYIDNFSCDKRACSPSASRKNCNRRFKRLGSVEIQKFTP